MANILVGLADAAERESAAEALRAEKYNVSLIPPPAAADNPGKTAKALAGAKAEAAILDYLVDDAAGVKLLQAAQDDPAAPGILFVLPQGTPPAHVVMAMNEGAVAVLERPLQSKALVNYVDRAVRGPSRLRNPAGDDADLAAVEREAKAMRIQLAAHRKLVSYLMCTPLSVQTRTALVVSDSAYQREFMKKILEEHGFAVECADNPDDGLKTALSVKPRVVVSDLEMEGKNGVEFCRDLKIVHKLMPCHFIICTANSEKADKIMTPGNGVDACLLKPSNESGNLELVSCAALGLLLQA